MSKMIEIQVMDRTICLPESYPVKTGDVVFLTASLRGCLMLYEINEWLPFCDRMFSGEMTSGLSKKKTRLIEVKNEKGVKK